VSRAKGMKAGAYRSRGHTLPTGWRQAGRGAWDHDNGASVEETGRGGEYKFMARDPDGVWFYAATRGEALAWASGGEP